MKIPTRYLASLPERAGRAGAALLGGAAYEFSETALPEFVRRSKLYEATVARVLRITIELLGDVRGVYPDSPMTVEELTVRKAAGNVVEFASVVVAGWSPLWLLAGAADVIGGSKVYLRALVQELEQAGLLEPGTDISTYEDLLSRLEGTSGVLADAVDVPPLSVDDLRASWRALQSQATDLPSPEGLASIFAGLQEAARREGRSLLEVSTLVGLGAARAGIRIGDTYVFDYYRRALRSIAEEGLLAFLRRISSPYLERAGKHFDPAAPTYTERLLERLDRRRAGRGLPRQPGSGTEASTSPPLARVEGSSEAS
ncbi:hypothetical protein NET02_00650 [Thermomicrobiaceae bacterium CFH 74404]|uniref:Uncharacterized protein n=1 Tax=Thermalbibacter longus TaxID=2951981 RepID=A0AA42BBC3_9BACT|nr:hypothetical protein [Thermalbibacter longus]MCM8747648.1 hypothetical protein [Thermalbibacter longus]